MKLSVFIILILLQSLSLADSNPLFLVDTDWLQKHIKDRNLFILDVRDESDYKSGTLEGAINLPVTRTYRSGEFSYLVREESKMIKLIGDTGVSNNDLVLIVDDGSMKHAARMFWIFEYLGHERVVLLDGGIEKWRAEKRRISDKQIRTQSKNFISKRNDKRYANKKMVHWSIIDKNYFLVDSRPIKDYEKAHIKTAIHLPIAHYFKGGAKAKSLKNNKELEAIFSPFKNAKKIITYCQKGRDSSLTYFMMRRAGFNVSHYDGSWPEWNSSK